MMSLWKIKSGVGYDQVNKSIIKTESGTIIEQKILNCLQLLNTQDFTIQDETTANGVPWYACGVVSNLSEGRQRSSGIPILTALGDATRNPLVRFVGWNVALKPANEPIVLARKPLEGTVAGNVLKHGTGGMNVDGCQIGDAKRWPANLIHDGSPEVLACFPQTGKESAARFFYVPKSSRAERDAGCEKMEAKQIYNCDNSWGGLEIFGTTDGGRSPARNNHATVKPLALMRYLCRLITPPGGLVLDPFCGSGSTCIAAMQEGFSWLGIDRDAHSIEIAEARMAHWRAERGD